VEEFDSLLVPHSAPGTGCPARETGDGTSNQRRFKTGTAHVSFVAAFTGLALTNNISRLPDAQRKALIVMSAFILGGGIWSMHFVAMLAVKIDQTIYYDLLQTLGSALVAILVAGLALLILHFSKRTRKMLTLAGVILGFGIVAMHFIGMNGMRGVTPKVSIGVVLLTIVVAIATGVAAIRAAYGNRSRQNIIAGAAVFGSAVVAVHFTAMHGTQFVPGPPPDSQSVFIGDGTLAVTVTITVFIICGAFLLAAIDNRLTHRRSLALPAQPTTDGRVDDRHNATLNASGHAAVTRSSPSGAAGSTGALNEPPVHDNRAVADAVRQSQTAPVSQPVVDSSQPCSVRGPLLRLKPASPTTVSSARTEVTWSTWHTSAVSKKTGTPASVCSTICSN